MLYRKHPLKIAQKIILFREGKGSLNNELRREGGITQFERKKINYMVIFLG